MKTLGARRANGARLRIRTQPTSGLYPRLGEMRLFRIVGPGAREGAPMLPHEVTVAGDGSVVVHLHGRPVLRCENLAQLLTVLGMDELELEEI